jgi:CBS domain-containing protein
MKDPHQVSAGVVVDFLSRTLPFSDLDRGVLEGLARACTIDFVPKGVRLMTQGQTRVESLYLVQSGGVKLFLTDGEGQESLVDYRGEGAAVGALALIRGSPAHLNVETVEDTFFFKMAKKAFLDLLAARPALSQYYIKSFSDAYIAKAFEELRRQKIRPRTDASLQLFTTPVAAIIRRAPVSVFEDENIRQAAGVMAEERVGSLLVQDHDRKVIGIVTDKDFRFKVVSQGLNYNWPVAEVMSSPVETIDEGMSCFNALVTMMKRQIHHLGVTREGGIIGVVTSNDILVLQGHSPFALYKEIVSERRIEGLCALSTRVPMTVRGLIEEGAKANSVSRMIAVLNDLILERLLSLMQEELGPPPVEFCWLFLGSEGRMEQTFKTDQDNALLYAAPENPEQRTRTESYFTEFGKRAIEHLVACGYPRCPGNLMASNPDWRKSYADWQDYFFDLVRRPEPERVLKATIFFDFRPGYGRLDLGARLRDVVSAAARGNHVFLRYLARDCLTVRPPLSFFRNIIVEKDGAHKNRLDLKLRGITPFVDFARVTSLAEGIKETNTMARLAGVYEAGALSKEFYSEIREAYGFIMQVRLVHQLRQMEQDLTPDNYLDPAELTELEKRTLKEAFAVIGAMQALLKETYRLNL